MVQYTQLPSPGQGGGSGAMLQANQQMIDQATGALEGIFTALKQKRKMKVYTKLMEEPFSKEGLAKAQALSPELGGMYLNSHKSMIAIEQALKEGDYEDTMRQVELGNFRNAETLDMVDALMRIPEQDRMPMFQMFMENADPQNEIEQGAIGAINMWVMNPQTGQPELTDEKLGVMKGGLVPYSERIKADTAAAAEKARIRDREDTQSHERTLQGLENQGDLNVATVEGRTKLMLQDLENEGNIDVQSLKNLAPAQLFAEAQKLADQYELNPTYVEQVLGNYKGTNPNFDPGLGGAIPRQKLGGGGGGLITAEDLNSKIMGSGGSQPTEQQGQSVPNTPTDPALPQPVQTNQGRRPVEQGAGSNQNQVRNPRGRTQDTVTQGKPKGGGKTMTIKIDGDAQSKPDGQAFIKNKMAHIRAEAKRKAGSGRRVGASSEDLVRKIENGVKDGSVVMYRKDGKMYFQDAVKDEELLSVRE